MTTKRYDAVIAVDEYTDAQGSQKTRWQNVGAVLQTDNGFCLLLDRTFNPAGVRNPEGRTNVLINLFEPQQNQQQGQRPQQRPQQGNAYRQQTQGRYAPPPPMDQGFTDELDDDIPF